MCRIKSNSVLLNKMKQKVNEIYSTTAVNDKTTSIAERNCVRSQSQATNGSQLIGQQTALLTDADLITALIRLSTRCLSANYPWKPVSWETTRLAGFQLATRGNYCPDKPLDSLAYRIDFTTKINAFSKLCIPVETSALANRSSGWLLEILLF